MSLNLLILGAGAHGKVVEEIAKETQRFNKISFLDDYQGDAIGKISELLKFKSEYNYFIPAVGNNKLRFELFTLLKEYDLKIPILIHPKSFISKTAKIGEGTIIEIGAIINSYSIIGKNCIIGCGSVIDHNVKICDNIQIDCGCTIKPGTIISNGTKVTLKECNQII